MFVGTIRSPLNPPEDLFDLSCVKWWFPLGFSYSKEQVHGDKHANGACVTLWSKKLGWLVRREFVELEVLGVWAIVSRQCSGPKVRLFDPKRMEYSGAKNT